MDVKLLNKQYVKKLEEVKERIIDLYMEKIFMDIIKKFVENELSLKEMILKFIEERGKIIFIKNSYNFSFEFLNVQFFFLFYYYMKDVLVLYM